MMSSEQCELQESKYEHQRIAYWAYRYWEDRGRPVGSPEEDWFRAEREYRERNPKQPPTLLGLGPNEL
jgi:DUF2934 family protein